MPCLKFWLAETVRDNKYCYYLNHSVSTFICYAAVYNEYRKNLNRAMLCSYAACRCKIRWKNRDWYFLRYVTTSGPITESRTKLHSDWPCWWPKWDTMMDNSTCKARRGRGVLSRKWCWQTKSNVKYSDLIAYLFSTPAFPAPVNYNDVFCWWPKC